ncbi:MAG: tetratricopeptide repeat protein [Chloroflexota bacterium]
MPAHPSGTVSFLFTDIQGSTSRWESQPEGMAQALAVHDRIIRESAERHGGHVFKALGDAFFVAFATANDALGAALDAQLGLASAPWGETGPLPVRMALQTGAAEHRDGDYFGPPLNRAARLLSATHGGQVAVSASTAELARDALPESAGLLDLGDHRLRDLIRPERVFQLTHPELPAEFPPLASLDQRAHNLPVQATPFVGREGELETVRDLLRNPEVRLLTLTGPGGTGKTRLSLQAAAELIDEVEGGVFFVPLAPAGDLETVVGTIAEAVGIREGEGRTLEDQVTAWIGDRRVLLVLDNFEQVLDAAPLLGRLLASCPSLKLLVTSRSLLRVYGEHDYPVPPLRLPDLDSLPSVEWLSQYEAVRLFIERAQAVRPDFAITNENAPAVAEICVRLDGLPLAIELAAARVRLLSPDAILARLGRSLPLLTGGARDLPARQQTLRGAIAWGYDLLEPAEQQLFRRLSVFAGSFGLDTAERVCVAGNGLELDLLDGVASLVDKSLLKQSDEGGEPRFSMLQTIREFGLERLLDSEDGDCLVDCYTAYYRALAIEADHELRGPRQQQYLQRLTREHGNLRGALRLLIDRGQLEEARIMAAHLWWFVYLRGRLHEGLAWLNEVVALEPGSTTPGQAAALGIRGILQVLLSSFEAAESSLTRAAELVPGTPAERLLGSIYMFRGVMATMRGDEDRADEYSQAAEAAFAARDDTWGLGMLSFFRGNTAFGREDLDEAERLAARSLELFRTVNDPWATALPGAVLGRVATMRGEHERARRHFDASLAVRRTSGDGWGTAHMLNGAGDAARAAGDLDHARLRYEESARLFREAGGVSGLASSLHNLGHVAHEQGRLRDALTVFQEAISIFRKNDDQRGIAECLAGVAAVVDAQGDSTLAATLFGASAGILQRSGTRIWPGNRPSVDRNLARAKARAGAAFETAHRVGSELATADAIALAGEVAARPAQALAS